MSKWSLAVLYLMLLIGAVSASQIDNSSEDAYLTCEPRRLLSFGTTHREEPVAEFGAIVRWRHDTKKRGEGYDNWSLAKERNVTCWRVPKGPYRQCKASAIPCRPKQS